MGIKKKMILLAVVLGLSGCSLKTEDKTSMDRSEITQEQEASGSQAASQHEPVTVRQGEKSIELYELLVSDMSYTGRNGLLFSDGARLSHVLSEVAEDLPSAQWEDGFMVQIPEHLTLNYIDIFDKTYELVDRHYGTSDENDGGLSISKQCMDYLEELPCDTYYVSIAVVEEGEYIKEEDENEYTIYEYAFRLDKNLPPYTYSGKEPYIKEICEYFRTLAEGEEQWNKDLAVSDGKGLNVVYIPVPVILKTETVGHRTYVYGQFWDMWYALDGTNLYNISGGENSGRLELTEQNGELHVTGFEQIRDGDAYVKDWKRLCKDDQKLYESLFAREKIQEQRENLRREMILLYALDNRLDIESYQDFGWDPVSLSPNTGIDYYGKLIQATRECILQNRDGKTSETYEFSPGEPTESLGYMIQCSPKKDGEFPEKYYISIVMMTPSSYETLGYLIKDIDGNGTDELIFGGNETSPDSAQAGIIYDIYTISDGKLVHVLNGWERNRYYLCDNGMIANESSGGAAHSSYSYFTFKESELHLVESVIYDGDRDRDNPWFYSTESEYDTKNADPISEKKADEIKEMYTYQYPAFIPFTEDN